MNILQKIAEISKESPNKTAYRVAGESISYGELWEQSNAVADALRKKELSDKSPIAVYGHMSPQQIVAFLGVVKAGHPYIPLDISIPSARISHIIGASKASFVITTEAFDMPVDVEEASVDKLISEGQKEKVCEQNWVKGDEVFYIIYTSGSTGNPKGVQISESNLASFVEWLEVECALPNGVYLNQAPYSFDLSVMDLYPALTAGRELHAITKVQIENASLLFEELAQSKIGVWTSTPSFVKICLMNPEWNAQQMPHLTTFLFCGEVLPHRVASELHKRFPKAKVYNLYGPTETTVAVSAIEVTKEILEQHEQLPIARADSPTLKIVDEHLQPVVSGSKGEIAIYGPTVSTEGYLYASEQSAAVFKYADGERLYKAGDVGFVEEGFVFYAGRSDFQIKLHGYRMEIEEIEKQIEDLDEVVGCVVIPVKKDEEVVSLTACIALTETLTEKPFKMTKNLKSSLLNSMPSYMIPKKFMYVDTLPLTMNGKVDRKRMAVEMVL